jgi:arsenate reductase
MSVANRKLSTVNRLKVLFLCTGNSCRSQMAEGWARHLKSDEIEAYSAGIEKHGMNTLAVKVMADAGVDISRQYSKVIDELPIKEFDFVITLCDHANETCPFFPGRKIHIGFDDPPKLAAKAKTEDETLIHYRRIRNEIRDFIITLPEGLQGEQGGDAT